MASPPSVRPSLAHAQVKLPGQIIGGVVHFVVVYHVRSYENQELGVVGADGVGPKK